MWLYRGMVPGNDGLPQLGDTPTTLGLRKDPAQGKVDVAPDVQGNVEPTPATSGLGLSVSPEPRLLPEYRRPPEFGGTKRGISVYRIAVADLGDALARVPDTRTHELVQPRRKMRLADFEEAIRLTRTKWKLVKPGDETDGA